MKLTLLGVLLLASVGAMAADLRGRVELFADGKPLRASESAEAVVYFRPTKPEVVKPPKEPAVMTTRRKQFVPHVLAVAAGTTVRFPNQDPILHNTFSTSANNAFDAGLYGQGDGVAHTFAAPGLVKVYCNVHHSMFGFILVLDTTHFARPDAQGNFVLTGLPAGEGELVVLDFLEDGLDALVVDRLDVLEHEHEPADLLDEVRILGLEPFQDRLLRRTIREVQNLRHRRHRTRPRRRAAQPDRSPRPPLPGAGLIGTAPRSA